SARLSPPPYHPSWINTGVEYTLPRRNEAAIMTPRTPSSESRQSPPRSSTPYPPQSPAEPALSNAKRAASAEGAPCLHPTSMTLVILSAAKNPTRSGSASTPSSPSPTLPPVRDDLRRPRTSGLLYGTTCGAHNTTGPPHPRRNVVPWPATTSRSL